MPFRSRAWKRSHILMGLKSSDPRKAHRLCTDNASPVSCCAEVTRATEVLRHDKDDQTIVEAVIALGGAFRMQVVAEGAETPEHVRSLLELGCNVMQGYAIARPMPGTEVMDWVNSFRFEPGWKNGSFGPA